MLGIRQVSSVYLLDMVSFTSLRVFNVMRSEYSRSLISLSLDGIAVAASPQCLHPLYSYEEVKPFID